jgi:phage tail-like protein
MPGFTVNPHRTDPYKNFKFRLIIDGRAVLGISKVSALKRTTEAVEYREDNEPNAIRKAPGRTTFSPITLERGITHDPFFEDWASQVWRMGAGTGAEASLKAYRKDVLLHLCNEAGQVVMGWKIYRCWVSQYTAVPDLDSNASSVAIESIVLENEGWERDRDIVGPEEK